MEEKKNTMENMTKEQDDELKQDIHAFTLVKALDLLDDCHHYLKANPPSKETMNYNKWENLVEETDYMREYNANAAYERANPDDNETVEGGGGCFVAGSTKEGNSGSVAAPKEEVTLGVGDGSGQHFVSGSYDTIKLLQGKLIELESYRLSYTFEEDGETGLSLLDRLTPPGDTDISRGRDEIQLLTEEIELLYSKELTSLRQQLKEREEALKELLPIAEQYRTKIDNPNWEDDFNKSKAIIEKARKLLSK